MRILVILTAGLLIAGSATAQTASDARAFLQGLYAHYDGRAPDFSPLNDNAPQWFDPEMVALMQEDHRLAGGELTVIEADPICECQDYGHIAAEIVVAQNSPDHATAEVIVTETDPSFEASEPRHLTYDLSQVNGQWRIHDIGNSYRPSLRQAYMESNAELKKAN